MSFFLFILLAGWWRPLPLGVVGRGYARGRDGEGAGGWSEGTILL